MRRAARAMIILALGIPIACVAQTSTTATPIARISSPEDLKKLTSQIADLIAPFTL
jgi:hypothetical protein